MIIYNKKNNVGLNTPLSEVSKTPKTSLSKENVLFLTKVLGLKVRENGSRIRK